MEDREKEIRNWFYKNYDGRYEYDAILELLSIIDALRAERLEMMNWTPSSAHACPMYRYEKGKFVSLCYLHRENEELQASQKELIEAGEFCVKEYSAELNGVFPLADYDHVDIVIKNLRRLKKAIEKAKEGGV